MSVEHSDMTERLLKATLSLNKKNIYLGTFYHPRVIFERERERERSKLVVKSTASLKSLSSFEFI